MKMNFSSKFLIACTVLVVACGHKSETSTSKTTLGSTDLKLDGTFEQDKKEIETKGIKAENRKSDGSIVTTVDEQKLQDAFYRWLKDNQYTPSESDAAGKAEDFAKSPMRFVIFKHAFKFAHEDATGPQMEFDLAYKYAEGLLRDAIRAQEVAVKTKAGNKVSQISDRGLELIKNDTDKYTLLFNDCFNPKAAELARDQGLVDATALDVNESAAIKKECAATVAPDFMKEIQSRLTEIKVGAEEAIQD